MSERDWRDEAIEQLDDLGMDADYWLREDDRVWYAEEDETPGWSATEGALTLEHGSLTITLDVLGRDYTDAGRRIIAGWEAINTDPDEVTP